MISLSNFMVVFAARRASASLRKMNLSHRSIGNLFTVEDPEHEEATEGIFELV